MKTYIIHLITIGWICLFLQSRIIAQQVSNVSFELVGQNIHIMYSLTPVTEDEYEITSILKRTSDSEFNYTPENLTGDIGKGEFSGLNRKIIWNVTEAEMEIFDGDDYYFEVFAKKVEPSGGGIPWYYYAGTAAVGGAVAAFLLGGSDDKNGSNTTTPVSFPPPPGRP